MYLSSIKIENFRTFGSLKEEKSIEVQFSKGLNLIVGENDSGKTALIDAIRYLLGTKDYEWNRLTSDDFYLNQSGERAKTLRIEGEFALEEEEAAMFLEWLEIRNTEEETTYHLKLWIDAIRREISQTVGINREREVEYELRAGPGNEGTRIERLARDLLRATYLRPLRDAEHELSARRGSRLSQILLLRPDMKDQDIDDPDSIIGILAQANNQVRTHSSITDSLNALNTEYLDNLKLGNDTIQADITISDPKLRNILEQLQLQLTDQDFLDNDHKETTQHGLGWNNILFMATELLLLQDQTNSRIILIEEPEAHLHPQMQLRLVNYLQEQARAQVIMTSHSPNLASSIELERLIVMHSGQAYEMKQDLTRLENTDYRFLSKFLDVTKANLFFARGVLIVEGYAEQILLPTLARLIGRPLEKFGVSIVNVGHVGLFRYSRIFQRTDGKKLDVRVACIRDRDNKEDDEVEEIKTDLEGDPVQVFVSPVQTLEHDFCLNGHYAEMMHTAIKLAQKSKNSPAGLTKKQIEEVKKKASEEYTNWKKNLEDEEIAKQIYRALKNGVSKTETAQYFALLIEELGWDSETHTEHLPKYLVDALNYVTRKQEDIVEEAATHA